jgi:hypothetical protein
MSDIFRPAGRLAGPLLVSLWPEAFRPRPYRARTAAWSEKGCRLFCPAGLPVPVRSLSLFLPVIDLFEKCVEPGEPGRVKTDLGRSSNGPSLVKR